MQKITSFIAFSSMFALLAFGENFSGKLVDANCYTQQKKLTGCDASSTTTQFALQVSSKLYMLDTTGNTKAASAMANRADRATDPNHPAQGVVAKVTGTQNGGTIAVDSIDIQ